jgi:hypothetical protein
MELFDNLASIGLTAKVLQFIIIGGIAIFLIGMFWRYIVIGAGILFCVVVFAMPSKQDKPLEVKAPQVEKVTPEVQSVEPAPPVVEVKPEVREETKVEADERMFLEDCRLHSGYTSAQCKALWEDNKDEIEKSSWKYKHNKNYKAYMKKVKYGA